ncbi:hypothetical protein BH23ACT11_BH23ACT11_06620 [soil metagenome]
MKKTGMQNQIYAKLPVVLAGAGVSLFVFALYLATLAPTILYYDRPLLLDSAMLQVQAYVLGIPGPTGEPSWVMLTHLFKYLPFGDPGYRMNLSSAVYAAGTVLLVFAAGFLLSRRVVAAAAGALALGLGGIFWSQAVVTEVYTLNALLIMAPIVSLLVWRDQRQDRYLLLVAFLLGFALTNHLTSGLVILAGLLFVGLTDRSRITNVRLILKAAGLFLLGLMPYLYLPIRAAMNPAMNEGDPSTFGRFWYLVSGGGHHSNSFAYGPAEIPARLMLYGQYLLANFHWGLLAVAGLGAMYLILRDRAAAALVILPYPLWTLHAVEYRVFDVQIFFIPSYLMLALAIAVGFGFLLREAEHLAGRIPSATLRAALLVMVYLTILLNPLAGLRDTYAANDMSEDYRGREIIETVAKKALPNSTVLHHRSALWYMVLIEERRQDLTLIDPLRPGWTRYTDIVWPDDLDAASTERLYGTEDNTGVATARKAAENGPVYVLKQDSVDAESFWDAGFETVHVPGGNDILFELVPPGREPHPPSS